MERYQAMTPSSEGTNPLRPYYRPPSIGLPASPALANASTPSSGARSSQSPSFGSSAREILSDIDYDGFLGGARPTTAETAKRLLDQAVWKYSSVFLSHPFEVAKTVLQCHLAGKLPDTRTPYRRGGARAAHSDRNYREQITASDDSDNNEDDDDDDASSYFTTSNPNHQYRHQQHQRIRTPQRPRSEASSRHAEPSSQLPPYCLEIRKADSISDALSQLWSKEGAWGFWKGTNISFIHAILLKGIESWTRGMLAALLNLPDPGLAGATGGIGGLDIIDSPSPLSSFVVAVSAAGIAGLILAPLDMARTRLILTPISTTPRSIMSTLKTLPSYIVPSSLFTPTLIHSTLPTLISSATPLFLRANLGIDPILTPTSYSVCTFMASTFELFLRLPVETVLRRGQIQAIAHHEQHLARQDADRGRQIRRRQRDYLGSTSSDDEEHVLEQDPLSASTLSAPLTTTGKLKTIVEVGPYSGMLATMWRIAREEGESLSKTQTMARKVAGAGPPPTKRKGQGIHGLWRGWRVGWWGLVGVWVVAGMGGGSTRSGEF